MGVRGLLGDVVWFVPVGRDSRGVTFVYCTDPNTEGSRLTSIPRLPITQEPSASLVTVPVTPPSSPSVIRPLWTSKSLPEGHHRPRITQVDCRTEIKGCRRLFRVISATGVYVSNRRVVGPPVFTVWFHGHPARGSPPEPLRGRTPGSTRTRTPM